MPSNNEKNKACAQTEFQLGVSASKATALKSQDKSSGEWQEKNYGPDSFKVANSREEAQLKRSAEESAEKQRHVMKNIASQYKKSSGWERGIGYFNRAWRNFIWSAGSGLLLFMYLTLYGVFV